MTDRRRLPRAVLPACVLTWVLAWVLAAPAAAQISPGELSAAHAEQDGSDRCLLCHSQERGVDPALCLDCHRLLGEHVDAGAGLHARPGYDDCRTCHIEHHGREFELVYWDAGVASFDHREAGFGLEGRHAALRCRECHRPELIAARARLEEAGKDLGRTFLGLATGCLACHAATHRRQLGPSCLDCHTQEAWRPAPGFDHQVTAYPLTGRHRDVACDKCHPALEDGDGVFRRYRGVASSCTSCHRDPHAGRLGGRCEGCHSTASWRGRIDAAAFDHDRTRYRLVGLHRRVPCDDCHQGRPTAPIPRFERCATCHADVHLGQLARRDGRAGGAPRHDRGACDACHGVEGFLPARYTLEDHQGSRYPLAASHLAVACPACHRPVTARELATLEPSLSFLPFAEERVTPRFLFSSTSCVDCHGDPHGGELEGGCPACHDLSSWRSITFDHDRSAFPLKGRHRAVSCEACHPREAAGRMRLSGTATGCTGCHRDPHRGQLDRDGRPACESCHTLEDWRPTLFDHDRDAAYLLDGAHRRVPCAGCHPVEGAGESRRVRYRPLPAGCVDCHGAS